MAIFDSFTNEYSVSKTLRFELRPEYDTLEHLQKDGIIDNDEKRAEDYKVLKKLMDEYYKAYIEEALSEVELEGLEEYERLYNIRDKSEANKIELEAAEENFRKQIALFLSEPSKYKSLFKQELISKELPEFLTDEAEIELVKSFDKFTTICVGFWENRKNVFSEEKISTSIAYRTIHENLPKFIANMKLYYSQIKDIVESKDLSELFDKVNVNSLDEVFTLDFFSKTLSQAGIDRYNCLLGGFALDETTKIQGLNEIINLYNQKNKGAKVGLFRPLFKQILSDRNSASFTAERFDKDAEVIDALKVIKETFDEHVFDAENGVKVIFNDLCNMNLDSIYIKNDGSLTELSNKCYGDWNEINQCLNNWYDNNYSGKPKEEWKYKEERKNYFKKKDSFSISFINDVTGRDITVVTNEILESLIEEYQKEISAIGSLLDNGYPNDRNLISDDKTIGLIKAALDSMKAITSFVKLFDGSGSEPDRNDAYYGLMGQHTESFTMLNSVYNKTRNYVTRKPYSNEKIKLTFDAPTLLSGWALSKESDNKAVILRKDGLYYLGIMNKKHNKIFVDIDEFTGDDCFEKMEYLFTKDANKSIPKCSTQMNAVKNHFKSKTTDYVIDTKQFQTPLTITKEIFDINNVKYDGLKQFQKEYLKKTGDTEGYWNATRKWIDFCMDFLKKYKTTSNFDFSSVYPTSQFESVSDFYNEIDKHMYKIEFKKISSKYIEELVHEGKLYLFKIYNKDFSPHTKGRPNLHTLYFKALFAEENAKVGCYKLNGSAEMFYRKKSINLDEAVVHQANQPIENKNELNDKRISVFDYDIIKDRRYTVDKFQFHVPITMNYQAGARSGINLRMREAIKENSDMHVIGIDRGERHLLYVSIIDLKGNIKEQFSLNEIINEHNGNAHKVDYHGLLDKKENERLEARQDWKTVESIKELKDGYMSQVVHVITNLMIKYNAIVVMEDLNSGFKRGRQKVEKQVYQKFEKAMIDKLNYYVNKSADEFETTGVYKALQLTEKFESFKKMGKQNGAIFYVPAWNTSKMDPTTGFVNFLDTRYESLEKSKRFFEKMQDIRLEKLNGVEYLAFDIDYDDYTAKAEDTRTKWTVCSYGRRIISERNSSGYWESREIDITEEFLNLFNKYNIVCGENIKNQILAVDDASFFKKLMKLMRYMLQIRNSEINGTVDYIISPVMNNRGEFFSTDSVVNNELPVNADANGAYNIARKGLWIIEQIKRTNEAELRNIKMAMTNKEWLQFAQRG